MIFIVHKNYENYVSTMLTIMALGFFVLFVGYCIVPETIVDFAGEFEKRLKRAGDVPASPLNTIRFFNQYIELRRLAIVILLSCSAISCLTIIQGYTVAQYGWTQTKSVVVLVTIGVFAGPSVIFSPLIIAKKGAMRAVQMAFYMMMVGLAILIFSPMNPLFLYIGCGVVAAAAFGAPAYLTLISNFQLANARFGELQSGMGAMALLAMSLGTIFYSTLFLFLPKSMRFLIFLMVVQTWSLPHCTLTATLLTVLKMLSVLELTLMMRLTTRRKISALSIVMRTVIIEVEVTVSLVCKGF